MSDLIRKLIEWAYFKYVVDYTLEQEEEEQEYEIVFEPDPDLVLESISNGVTAQEFIADALSYYKPHFNTEVEQAMYEKKFATVH